MMRRMNAVNGYTGVAQNLLTGLVTAGLLLISFTTALAQSGVVKSWGSNLYGQKSGGNSAPATLTRISAGANHTLALDSAGNVWAWGDNRTGQLGDGTLVSKATATQVAGVVNAVQVAAGQDFSLVLTNDGKVWSFGNNGNGQLGDGSTTTRKTPVAVTGLSNVVQIAAGGAQSLALISDGTVRSWGYNIVGELGDGTTSNRTTPVKVKNLTNVIQVAAGYYHSMAVGFDGTAWSWGWNKYGQLGDGTNVVRKLPVQMTGLANVQQVSAGSYHSIALGFDGSVWTTGYNLWGQIGNGSPNGTNRNTAIQLVGLTDIVQVSAGNGHNLIVKKDGTLWSWGNNEFGQLGDGTGTNRSTPVQVLLAGPTYLTAGWYHSAAVQAVTIDIKVVLSSSKFQYASPLILGGALKTVLTGFSVLQQPLNFKLGSTDLGTSLTNASAKIFVPLANTLDFTVGTYLYDISCVGDRLFNPTVRHGKLVIIPADTPQRANGASVGKLGQTLTFATILKRKSDGALLSNRTIHFLIDGVSIGDATTDGTGRAALPYKLEEPLTLGVHTLTTNYDGEANHNPSTLTINLTVNQSASTIGVNKVVATYGKTALLQATLTRKTDNKRLANMPVTFSLDGVAVGTVNTDVNGLAKLPYLVEVPFALGVHPITADFAGTENYTAISGASTLTVGQAATALAQLNQVGKVGVLITLKATLTRTTDKMGLANKTVTFIVNGGVVGTAITDASGVALLPSSIPDLPTGKYNMTVSFDGDSSYLAVSNIKGTLTVR